MGAVPSPDSEQESRSDCRRLLHFVRHVGNDDIVDNFGNVAIPARILIDQCLQYFAILMSELPVLFEHLKEASLLIGGSVLPVEEPNRVPSVNRHEEIGKQKVHRLREGNKRRLRLDEFEIVEQKINGVDESAVRFLDLFEFDFDERLNGIGMLLNGLYEIGWGA